MKLKRHYTIFVFFTLLLVCGCALSSSKKSANLILYVINERTEDFDDLGTSLYTVSEKDGEPNKIYEVAAPQLLQAWFSPDGSKVMVLTWQQVAQPNSSIPGASFTLFSMDADGNNPVFWVKDLEVKYTTCQPNGQFSADGKHFLYITPASEDCDEYQLYTANPDGKDEKLIDQATHLEAEFSPDGDRLLVSSQVRDTANKKTTYDIYYVNVKGGEPDIVWSSTETGTPASAKVAGSDQVLLVVVNILDDEVEFSMMSADFKEKTPVATLTHTRITDMAVSKDTKYIGMRRYGVTCPIFSVITVATGEIRDVSCWYETPFQFSSNGKYLLVSALGEYGDFSVPGTNQMLLEPNGDLIETLEPPTYLQSTLSPDGNRLTYWSRDPATKELCLNIRDLETDKVTLLSRTCVPGSTNIPGGTSWK